MTEQPPLAPRNLIAALGIIVVASVQSLLLTDATAADTPPSPPPAAASDAAPTDTDEQAVRTFIDAWYAELKLGEDGHPWRLFAPGAIIASRSERANAAPPGAAGIRPYGPPFPNELIRRAGKFSYEIENLLVQGRLAKVRVWERAWIYAWAAKQTYQNAAEANFVLERSAEGRWLILAFQSYGQAPRPKDKEEPMPDLSPEAK